LRSASPKEQRFQRFCRRCSASVGGRIGIGWQETVLELIVIAVVAFLAVLVRNFVKGTRE
jgi:hypothetical protein